MDVCIHCGASPVKTGATCWRCGKTNGSGGNILVVLAWLFIPLSIPVYPILGGLSTLAMATVGWLTTTLGLYGGFRIIAIAAVGYVALYLLSPVERAASRVKVYRLLRTVIRVGFCAGLAIVLLNAPARDISPANAAGLALVGVPLLFFIARRFDRVLGMNGSPEAETLGVPAGETAVDAGEQAEGSDSWLGDAWRSAAILALIPTFLGVLIGREGRLFFAAVVWLAAFAIMMGWKFLRRVVSLSLSRGDTGVRPNRVLTGALRVVLLGAVLGTLVGAALLAMNSSSHVEAADLIAFAIIGVVVASIFAGVRRLFAAR